MRRSPKEGNMNESRSSKNKKTKHTHTLATEYIFILFYLFIADNPIKSKKRYKTTLHTLNQHELRKAKSLF